MYIRQTTTRSKKDGNSKVFAGNTSESATLQAMVTSLGSTEAEALIVMKRVLQQRRIFNSGKNKTKNYRYLVVSRKRHIEWDETFSQIVCAQGTNEVRIYSKNSVDGEEVELYCIVLSFQ